MRREGAQQRTPTGQTTPLTKSWMKTWIEVHQAGTPVPRLHPYSPRQHMTPHHWEPPECTYTPVRPNSPDDPPHGGAPSHRQKTSPPRWLIFLHPCMNGSWSCRYLQTPPLGCLHPWPDTCTCTPCQCTETPGYYTPEQKSINTRTPGEELHFSFTPLPEHKFPGICDQDHKTLDLAYFCCFWT